MNLFGIGLKWGGAFALGAGAVLLAPVLMPVIAGVLKPLTKNVFKGGILAYEGVKVALAETKETIEDIAAEAHAEVVEVKKPPAKTKKQPA
jgi:hypothetical protein